MSWTPTTFKARWAEFEPTDDTIVQNALDAAVLRVDRSVAGDQTDYLVGLLTAHSLSVGQFGQPNRLESKDGRTTYLVEADRVTRQKAGGPWRIGQHATDTIGRCS